MNYSPFRYVRVFSLVYTSRIIVHVRLVAFFYRILNKISRKLDFSFILYYFQAYWCLMMSKTYVAITEEITNDHPLIANTINSHNGLLNNIRTSARPRWLYITTRANASNAQTNYNLHDEVSVMFLFRTNVRCIGIYWKQIRNQCFLPFTPIGQLVSGGSIFNLHRYGSGGQSDVHTRNENTYLQKIAAHGKGIG